MRVGVAAVVGAGLTIEPSGAHDPITTKVTWNGEVARIVQARCIRCHAPDGGGPMPLTTWHEARPWAKAIKEEVLTRRMPKWHAARGYGDFANDPSLSPFEIALIAAWADGGAPEKPAASDTGSVASGVSPADPHVVSGFSRIDPQASSGLSRTNADPKSTTRTLSCGTQPLSGRLLAIRPTLAKGGSARITAQLPGGRQEIVAWIRGFDPDFEETYWLRTPLDLPPRSRLSIAADRPCRVSVTLGRGGR